MDHLGFGRNETSLSLINSNLAMKDTSSLLLFNLAMDTFLAINGFLPVIDQQNFGAMSEVNLHIFNQMVINN